MDKDGSKEGSPTSVLVLGIIVFLLLLTLTVLEGVYNCFKPLPPPPAGTAILILSPWELKDGNN